MLNGNHESLNVAGDFRCVCVCGGGVLWGGGGGVQVGAGGSMGCAWGVSDGGGGGVRGKEGPYWLPHGVHPAASHPTPDPQTPLAP
jgi:hypothetical protein